MTKLKLKQSQRLRVIVDGVSFYTTAKQVRNGVGDNTLLNLLVSKGLDTVQEEDLSGYGFTKFDHQVQVDVL